METRDPASLDLDGALPTARVKATPPGRAQPQRIGRFELLRRCGQGGEGIVYEAFDPACEQRVALKCLHPSTTATGATSLRREFRALSELLHPNLALLYELFWTGGQWFHTMELLAGVDFVSHVRRREAEQPVFDEGRLRPALVQLLQGLYAIHAAGKVHRDLKPSNVLVEPQGRVVIVDFGLMIEQPSDARAHSGTQRAGTAAYMAPEQLRAESVSAAADLYAVGAMLFEVLTGRRAHAEVAQQPCGPGGPDPLRPSQRAHDIPPDLDALCAELLALDPSRRPSAEAALARLGAAPTSAARSRPTTRECFVGRVAQLRALHAAYARSLAGQASCVLVHGDSGMGKSALLSRFCSELGPQPLLLQGRCYERENTPYKVLDAVVESLVDQLEALADAASVLPRELGALGQVFPAFLRLAAAATQLGTQPKDPTEQRDLAFAAMRELLQRVRASRAVVLCIDDLQWGDVDSMRLLQHVFAAPDAPALLFVGAYRRGEVHTSPFLRRALVEGGLRDLGWELTELSIDPLDDDEAHTLVRASTPDGELPGAQREDLDARIREARGVPFVLVALADPGQRAAPALPARDVVQARAARCSPRARSLLEILCVAGRPLEISVALQLTQAGAEAWLAASELCATRLTRWRDTQSERCIEPYHDLVRDAIVAGVDAERARHIHAAIAATMERLSLDTPEQLVPHLLAAGADAHAGQAAVVAGQRAAHKLAWSSAANFFDLALALLPEASARAQRLHEQLGDALARSGRHAASAAAYLRGARLEDAELDAELRQKAAQQRMRAGDPQGAIALLKDLMHEAGLRYPEGQWLAFAMYLAGCVRRRLMRFPRGPQSQTRPPQQQKRLATLAAVYAELWLVDPLRALVVHTWFFEEASHARDHYWLQALTWELSHLAVMHGPEAIPRLAQLSSEIDAVAEARGLPYELAVAKLARSVFLIHCQYRPREALRLIQEADQLLTTHCSGIHFERSWLELSRDFALEATGNFTALTEAALKRERECSQREDGYTPKQLLFTYPTAMLAQDRPEAALRFVRAHWTPSDELATVVDFAAISRSASALLYSGGAQASLQLLERHWPWLKRSGLFRSAPIRDQANFQRARCAAALYWQSRDPAWKRAAERAMREASTPTLAAAANWRAIDASLAWADGRERAGLAHLEEALAGFDAAENASAAWTVRYRLAQLRHAPQDLAAAAAWLEAHGVRHPERWAALLVPGASEKSS